MTNGFQTVPLGDFLTQRKEFFTIDDFAKYKRARVQSHGKGIILRDEISGTEIKTKKQQAARSGEFLVAEIDAKVGGFGIVPPELDSAVVSSHYFLFQINDRRCSKEWLNWFVRYNSLEEQTKAQGSTNYAAIRPSDVLKFQIPLPPLDEQRRIVEHIESLATRITKAQSLRKEANIEANGLLASAFNHVFDESNSNLGHKQYLKGVATIARGKFSHRPRNEPRFYGGVYPFVQIGDISNSDRFIHNYSQTLNEDGLKISRIFPKGTIVIAITGATIGVTGILEIDACFPDSIVGIISNHDSVLSEYIYWALEHTKHVAVNQATQTTQPNINLRILNELKIYVPPLDEQRRIVAYLDSVQARLASLRELQSQTGEELSALLPSVLDRAFKGEL